MAGTTNRLLARIADRRCEGFDNSFAPGAARRTTGNPVREHIFQVPALVWDGLRQPRLLVLGGSLGAAPLNKLLPLALALLPAGQRPQVRHQCGKQHVAAARQAYAAVGVKAEVEAFIGDMAEAYAWADLVVCRAGALTVAELAAAGRPALLMPLPHAIAAHQTASASVLAARGAAQLLPQQTLTAELLAQRLGTLLGKPETVRLMAEQARNQARPDATADVVRACLEVAHGR